MPTVTKKWTRTENTIFFIEEHCCEDCCEASYWDVILFSIYIPFLKYLLRRIM